MLLDMVAHSYPAVVHKVVESSKTSEKVKAILRNKLLFRDKGLRKKSYNFGDVVDDLLHEKSKAERIKEQNDKLLKMTGKEAKLSGNDKLAWISGKGASDQVAVRNSIIKALIT